MPAGQHKTMLSISLLHFDAVALACPMPCPAALRKMCIFALLTRIGHETLGRLPACVMQHASGLAEGVAGYVEA